MACAQASARVQSAFSAVLTGWDGADSTSGLGRAASAIGALCPHKPVGVGQQRWRVEVDPWGKQDEAEGLYGAVTGAARVCVDGCRAGSGGRVSQDMASGVWCSFVL